MRPYSCLPYAWDETEAAPRRVQSKRLIAVDLPGGRRLGHFSLIDIGSHFWVRPSAGIRGGPLVVPLEDVQAELLAVSAEAIGGGSGGGRGRRWEAGGTGASASTGMALTRHGSGQQQQLLLVLIEADGPTRVLRIIDACRHLLPSPYHSLAVRAPSSEGHFQGSHGEEMLADKQTLGLRLSKDHSSSPQQTMDQVVPGAVFKFNLAMSTVGISLVSRREELLYLRVRGIKAKYEASQVEASGQVSISSIKVNPAPCHVSPVHQPQDLMSSHPGGQQP